ncbi:MAG: hypothetical protein WDZ31_07365 [Phycisphaeraceae bacterium]
MDDHRAPHPRATGQKTQARLANLSPVAPVVPHAGGVIQRFLPQDVQVRRLVQHLASQQVDPFDGVLAHAMVAKIPMAGHDAQTVAAVAWKRLRVVSEATPVQQARYNPP